jgi:hypothetical protein
MPSDAVAGAIVNAIQNAGLVNVRASSLGYTQNGAGVVQVIVRGASALTGFTSTFTGAIQDLAGNDLKANQSTGETIFTIFLGNGVDYGDAPATYGTISTTAASHPVVVGFQLGANIDAEPAGQPTASADGDDLTGVVDDEDGVVFSSPTQNQGGTFSVTVTASKPGAAVGQAAGFLDAFFDFNRDGDFDDGIDRVFSSRAINVGPNTLSFTVPPTASVGTSYARFRFSSTGGLGPNGSAVDGEVEDYQITIGGPPWQNTASPNDVNNDAHVSPIDVLLIVNFLNTYPSVSALPNPPPFVPSGGAPIYPDNPGTGSDRFLDVSGDGFIAPNDALQIINLLNAGGGGEGEGADVPAATGGSTAEFVFAVGQPATTQEPSSSVTFESARSAVLTQFSKVAADATIQIADELAQLIGDPGQDRQEHAVDQLNALDALFSDL